MTLVLYLASKSRFIPHASYSAYADMRCKAGTEQLLNICPAMPNTAHP
jgi:hypothetical protein